MKSRAWLNGLVALMLLASAQAQAQELIRNSGFESDGLHWGRNTWGKATYSTAVVTTHPHSANKALKIEVTALPTGAGYIFQQTHTLAKGRLYEASIWVRAVGTAQATFYLRKVGPWYNSFACRTLNLDETLNPGWQQFTIRGGASEDTPVFFGIGFKEPGSIIVDDASLKDVTASSIHANTSVVSTEAIPRSYFGLHINKGHHGIWPGLGQGIVRLWDTGTMWKNLEPSDDAWNWKRMDLYVNSLIHGHDPTCKILYTLGQTPAWAASNPQAASGYGAGASSPPADIEEWREYVRTVATRYAGKIQYYEMWNETDVGGRTAFYSGSVEKMVEMTQAARQEILAIDPTAKIIAPNVTASGLGWLESFLAAGGDAHVDLYSIHIYTALAPEDALIILTSFRELLASYGVNKPVWDTEGRAAAPSGTTPTASEARAAVARNYLTKWAFGASNFSWYAWDINTPNLVTLSVSESGSALADGGIAYREVANWLAGARMLSKRIDADNTWIVELLRSESDTEHIVWNPTGSRAFTIPLAWGATTTRDLTGASAALAGNTVTIGPEPILLASKG
ncbi:MAG: carbohydrate binding domain-containing protein [Armatimonadota bacterium]|nr:carbohydrate binding domain-containing protein [Armatimonadota bacterium]